MSIDRYDNSHPPMTDVRTRIMVGRNAIRAEISVIVHDALSRAELELLVATTVADLLDGNVRAGGERFADLSLLTLAAKANLPVKPQLLVLPSAYAPFVRRVEGVVVFNPGFLCKTNAGGTFGLIEVDGVCEEGGTKLPGLKAGVVRV